MDTAEAIAKAAAAVIPLENDLMVLDDRVIEERNVFVNILKYVRVGANSDFPNGFSVLWASAYLPVEPVAPIQVLANNLLYAFSQVPIPTENDSTEPTAKPKPRNIGDIRKFMRFIGPASSVFDFTTFFVVLKVFDCSDPARASLFQTGWVVESLITQNRIIHVIRTNPVQFIRGHASWRVTTMTLLVMAIAVWLPYSHNAAALGFVPLPALYWPIPGVPVVGYVVLTQVVKN